MDLQTFDSLCLNARILTTWLDGTLLGARLEGGYECGLYHLGSFFVEVQYGAQDYEVLVIQGFTDEEHLAPYLERIELPWYCWANSH